MHWYCWVVVTLTGSYVGLFARIGFSLPANNKQMKANVSTGLWHNPWSGVDIADNCCKGITDYCCDCGWNPPPSPNVYVSQCSDFFLSVSKPVSWEFLFAVCQSLYKSTFWSVPMLDMGFDLYSLRANGDWKATTQTKRNTKKMSLKFIHISIGLHLCTFQFVETVKGDYVNVVQVLMETIRRASAFLANVWCRSLVTIKCGLLEE